MSYECTEFFSAGGDSGNVEQVKMPRIVNSIEDALKRTGAESLITGDGVFLLFPPGYDAEAGGKFWGLRPMRSTKRRRNGRP